MRRAAREQRHRRLLCRDGGIGGGPGPRGIQGGVGRRGTGAVLRRHSRRGDAAVGDAGGQLGVRVGRVRHAAVCACRLRVGARCSASEVRRIAGACSWSCRCCCRCCWRCSWRCCCRCCCRGCCRGCCVCSCRCYCGCRCWCCVRPGSGGKVRAVARGGCASERACGRAGGEYASRELPARSRACRSCGEGGGGTRAICPSGQSGRSACIGGAGGQGPARACRHGDGGDTRCGSRGGGVRDVGGRGGAAEGVACG